MNDHYTKAKRAASDTDDETWKRGGVTPTLNAMDNTGDTRATVLVAFSHTQGLDCQPSELVTPTVRVCDGGAVSGPVAILGGMTHSLTAEGHDASEDGTGRGTPIISVSNDSAPQVFEDYVGALKIGSGLGIPSAPSVMGQGVSQVRRLTPVECERLQGFPDNWTDGQADSARYRQMGNAVAVPVVEWIMRRLVAADEETS
jgi:hypothetical protein